MNALCKKPSGLLLLLSIMIYWLSPAFADTSFQNVVGTAGLSYQHADLTAELLDAVGELAMMSGGAAAGDFDGDGWMDLFVTRLIFPTCCFATRATVLLRKWAPQRAWIYFQLQRVVPGQILTTTATRTCMY